MKHKICFLLIFSLLSGGTVWNAHAQMTDQIIEAQGRVEIRRNEQRLRGVVGTELEYGDLLRPDRQSRIIVLCSNNTRWRVPPGRLSGLANGCPVGEARSMRGRNEDVFLAFLTRQFIFETQFLNSSPLLRWNPSPNVARYDVRVMQGAQVIWQGQSDRPQISYVGPALQPGIDYVLRVSSLAQTEPPIASLSFRVISLEQSAALQTAMTQLPQDLPPATRAIALTRIYHDVGIPTESSDRLRPGLVMEAIAALEPLIATQNQTAYLHRLLADQYLQVGLLDDAEARYQLAIALSTSPENTADRAAAQVGMANIRAAQGQYSDAATWLQLAKFNYVLLGRIDRSERIDQWLARIDLLR